MKKRRMTGGSSAEESLEEWRARTIKKISDKQASLTALTGLGVSSKDLTDIKASIADLQRRLDAAPLRDRPLRSAGWGAIDDWLAVVRAGRFDAIKVQVALPESKSSYLPLREKQKQQLIKWATGRGGWDEDWLVLDASGAPHAFKVWGGGRDLLSLTQSIADEMPEPASPLDLRRAAARKRETMLNRVTEEREKGERAQKEKRMKKQGEYLARQSQGARDAHEREKWLNEYKVPRALRTAPPPRPPNDARIRAQDAALAAARSRPSGF